MKFLDPDGVSYLWNAVKSRLAKKSDTGHTHSDSTITSLDASKLTGTIDLARLPQGSLERLVKVTDQSARFKLTSREVQLGDTVQQLDTGTMYIVVDEAQLSSEKGYTPYTAASATAVPWSGVTGKPETYPPASHSHSDYALTSHTHNYAGSSSAGGAANSAVKATQDSAGQQIDATYIKGLSVNGKVITYTKGDGNTGTITTQDTNTTYSAATQTAAGLMSAADKKKLDGIASGAGAGVTGVKGSAESAYRTGQVNLTAANVGAAAASHTHSDYAAASHTHSNYAASSHTHNYAGSSSAGGAANSAVKATQDSAGQQINTTYIKGLSVSGKVITYTKGDGKTGTITTQDTNTTYSAATQSAAGLMSAADKTKLDGVASGANKYTLPTASGSTLGGVKTTSTVTSTSGLTACPIIRGVPYYKDTNTTYSLSSFGVTATAAELNKMDGITAATAELNYCDGVTSNIQTQLNGKAASSHSHDYYNSIFIVSSSQPSVQTGKIWLKPV